MWLYWLNNQGQLYLFALYQNILFSTRHHQDDTEHIKTYVEASIEHTYIQKNIIIK
jgi:hypothetical protein